MNDSLVAPDSELPQALRDLPPATLANVIHDARAELRAMDEEHARKTQGLRARIAAIESFLRSHMIANEIEILPHDTLKVTCTRKTVLEKRISELKKLRGLVPEAELSRGLCARLTALVSLECEAEARQALAAWAGENAIQVDYEANATRLKPLRRYGKHVAKILEAGLVATPGEWTLSITEKQAPPRNVTPPQCHTRDTFTVYAMED
jgi:hypothetical protein